MASLPPLNRGGPPPPPPPPEGVRVRLPPRRRRGSSSGTVPNVAMDLLHVVAEPILWLIGRYPLEGLWLALPHGLRNHGAEPLAGLHGLAEHAGPLAVGEPWTASQGLGRSDLAADVLPLQSQDLAQGRLAGDGLRHADHAPAGDLEAP